ncbi:hypothetical protein ACLOJK_007290 [Asimina triloba]
MGVYRLTPNRPVLPRCIVAISAAGPRYYRAALDGSCNMDCWVRLLLDRDPRCWVWPFDAQANWRRSSPARSVEEKEIRVAMAGWYDVAAAR